MTVTRFLAIILAVAALVALAGVLAWGWPVWAAMILVAASAVSVWLVRPRNNHTSA